MGSLEKLDVDPRHGEFVDFLDKNRGARDFVDYKALNLMSIPHLIPNLWVLDFRNGIENGLVIQFSGSKIDEAFGENLMGKNLEDVFQGHPKDEMMNAYKSVYTRKQAVFISRSDYYENRGVQSLRKIKVLLYPCSTNDVDINYCVGLTTYTFVEGEAPSDLSITYL